MSSKNFLNKLKKERRVDEFYNKELGVWNFPELGLAKGSCRVDRELSGVFIVTFVSSNGDRVEFYPDDIMKVSKSYSSEFKSFKVSEILERRAKGLPDVDKPEQPDIVGYMF